MPDYREDAPDRIDQLADEPQLSLVSEFLLFLHDNKKWWLTPILLILLAATLLVTLTATGAAPWIYTMF